MYQRVLVGSPGSVNNNTQKVQRLHTLFFKVTNVWKECELIVKNDSEDCAIRVVTCEGPIMIANVYMPTDNNEYKA